MEFVVEAKSHLRKKFITALLPSMIKQLGLEKSKKSVLIMVDEVEALGVTVPFESFDCYLIVIKPQRMVSIGATLAHEMVHVKQMAQGKLRKVTKTHTMWAGKRYTKTTKYLDQPWEQQAFAMQELVFRRALES
jgi:hypothetical protein